MSTLFLLLFCFLSGCNKEDVKPNSVASYFPNNVGDSWEYDVTDSTQSTPNNPSPPVHYTIKVSITGTKRLLDGKDATIWLYQFPSINDTQYVRITGDTVKIFDLSDAQSIEGLKYPALIFLPPFEVNKRWDGLHLWVDSSRVINKADLLIITNTFSGCFNVYHYYLGPNTEIKDHYWFKPYVGMVSIYENHYINAPTQYRTWQLKTYSVN